MTPYIMCTGESGRAVIYGYCEAEPVAGVPVVLHRARMVLYWSAACGGLLGLAARGPQEGTRLTSSVDRTGTDAVRQWLTVSPEAAAALDAYPEYRG